MSIPYTRKIAETSVRINNIILYKGVPTRVEIFHLQQMQAFSADCEPVELTVGWLEKAGFEKWKDCSTYSYEFDGNSIQVTGTEVFLGSTESCTAAHGLTTTCQYLHELQNLFYSITKTELPINL